MPSPHSLRNGDSPSPHPPITSPHFHSTLSLHKLKRFNFLLLLFRLASFSFSLASSVFMLTNSAPHLSLRWYHFDAFRYVFAASAIVTIYSIFEMATSVWEISKNATLFPEVVQVWFDFGHDQVFAYLLLSADSAGTALVRTLQNSDTCRAHVAFCIQSDVAIALGYVGFMFLGLSSLLSGFRVVCFIINGSRFHL